MISNNNGKVLIVDDEPNAVRVLSAILAESGYNIIESSGVDKAIGVLKKEDIVTIITDLKMPGKDGLQLFEYCIETYPDIPVIFLTAYGTVESAVQAITRGAFYYFIKPPDYPKLKSIVARATEQCQLKREIKILRSRLEGEKKYHILGTSPEMLKIFETIEAIKNSASSVLIYGETGTGKELIARALHFKSFRSNMPFVAVNCAAIPEELLESELFGYEKGAFTGASSRRIGRFEEASGGTLFLDEIGELDISLQAKLLRAFEEREIERLGSNKKIKVDFRLISSTNRDLKKVVENGNFREDLFYRMNVVQITLPPLLKRKNDIPLLASEFLKEFCLRENKILKISDEVMTIFNSYAWPGNIRELRNVIERAVVMTKKGSITAKALPDELLTDARQTVPSAKPLKDMQLQAIKDALTECNGNKAKTARILGISRKALYKKLEEIQLYKLQ
ncbi:MAG: sigma-54 dependent transcriptional regulator [Nitrospirota bacterium]